jgi:hypothetical protein
MLKGLNSLRSARARTAAGCWSDTFARALCREARALREELAAATAQASGAVQRAQDAHNVAEAACRAQQAAERREREAEELRQSLAARQRREVEDAHAAAAAAQAELGRARASAATVSAAASGSESAVGAPPGAAAGAAAAATLLASPKLQLPQDPPPASPIKAWHVSAHLARAPATTPPPSPPRLNPALPHPLRHAPSAAPTPTAPAGPARAPPRRPLAHELPHELAGHERPGVVSRFPHRLSAMRAMRQELQAELEGELAAELAARGVDPASCRGLTAEQYAACMGDLQQRRAEARQAMSDSDRDRAEHMRGSLMQHVGGVMRQVSRAPPGGGGVLQRPGGLAPIRKQYILHCIIRWVVIPLTESRDCCLRCHRDGRQRARRRRRCRHRRQPLAPRARGG